MDNIINNKFKINKKVSKECKDLLISKYIFI
jgi:hypothetical protein